MWILLFLQIIIKSWSSKNQIIFMDIVHFYLYSFLYLQLVKWTIQYVLWYYKKGKITQSSDVNVMVIKTLSVGYYHKFTYNSFMVPYKTKFKRFITFGKSPSTNIFTKQWDFLFWIYLEFCISLRFKSLVCNANKEQSTWQSFRNLTRQITWNLKLLS